MNETMERKMKMYLMLNYLDNAKKWFDECDEECANDIGMVIEKLKSKIAEVA